jgi:hypothetical protein
VPLRFAQAILKRESFHKDRYEGMACRRGARIEHFRDRGLALRSDFEAGEQSARREVMGATGWMPAVNGIAKA